MKLTLNDDEKLTQLRNTIKKVMSEKMHLKSQLTEANKKVNELKESLFFVIYIIALLTVLALTHNEYKFYVLIGGFFLGLSIWVVKFDKNK